MGEAGESCNVAKKLTRIRYGLPGNREGETQETLQAQLGEELADTVSYLFLVADEAGIDLEKEVVNKFNKVSERTGLSDRLSLGE